MISDDMQYNSALVAIRTTRGMLTKLAILKRETEVLDQELAPFVSEFWDYTDDAAANLSVAIDRLEDEVSDYERLIDGGIELRPNDQLSLPLDIRRR